MKLHHLLLTLPLLGSLPASAQFATPTPLPLPDTIATDPFNDASQVGYCLDTTGANSCTAQDFRITAITITDIKDGCSSPDDYMMVDMDVTFSKGQPTRYEVGAWFYRGATGGGDVTAQTAYVGDFCTRVGIDAGLTTPGDVTRNVDGDACVDVPGNNGNIQPQNEQNFILPCRDVSTATVNDAFGTTPAALDGVTDISACTSWSNNSNQVCNTAQYQEFDLNWPNSPQVGEIQPETPSKCNCGEFDGGPIIVQVPDIVVSKSCTPTDVAPGDSTTCTITITNNGLGTMQGASADDTEGFFFEDNYPENQGSIVGATINPSQGSAVDGFISDSAGADTTDQSLNIYPGNIAGGSSMTVVYDFQTSASLPSTITTITNTVCGSYYNDSAPQVLSYASDTDMCASDSFTTPVTLAGFAVERNKYAGTLDFVWTTAAESGNLGFNLYARLGQTRFPVNNKLIQSKVVDSMTTTSYHFSVPDNFKGMVPEFFIEDVDIKGRKSQHGAFKFGHTGQPAEKLASQPTDWSAIHGERTNNQVRKDRRHATSLKNNGSGEIRVLVEQAGVHRITYAQLEAMGVAANRNASDYALSNADGHVPVYFGNIGRRGAFEAGSYMEFIGDSYSSLYTDQNVYTLTIGAGTGTEVSEVSASPRGQDFTSHYMHTETVTQNLKYSPSSPVAGEPWYDASLRGIFRPAQQSYDFMLDNRVDGMVSIDVNYWGGLDFPNDDADHHIEWSVNGTTLGSDIFNGIVERSQSYQLSTSSVGSSATVAALVPADTSNQIDIVNIESVSLTYPRSLQAQNNRLSFSADGRNLKVAGLTGDVAVYAQDGGDVTRLRNVRVNSGEVSFANVANVGSTYHVIGDQGWNTPVLEWHSAEDISSLTAQNLIISHPDFLGPDLSAYGAQRGGSTIVNVLDIYHAYSGGIVDAEAIRQFIQDLANRSALESILIVGGDTYDYHDNLGLGSISFVPTLYRATDAQIQYSAVDALYGDTTGNNQPDTPMGRLPVRTLSELRTILAKQSAFAGQSGEQVAILAADDSEAGAAYNFADNSNVLADLLNASGWDTTKVYLDDHSPATANGLLIDALNSGPRLAIFTGHSSSRYWSFNGLFSTYDAAALANHGDPFAVLQWGCWNTYFVEPREDSLGHTFMLSGNQGAAAVMGASTLTDATEENRFSALFQNELLAPGATFGEAMVRAKQAYAVLYGSGHKDIQWGVSLLGDPLLSVQ